jgi:hypothetical protein
MSMDMKIGAHVMGTPSLGVIKNDPPKDKPNEVNDGNSQPNAGEDKPKATDTDSTAL